MICALKINFVFLSIFTSAGLGFTLLSAAFWVLADGSIDTGSKLMVVSNTFQIFCLELLRSVIMLGNRGVLVCNINYGMVPPPDADFGSDGISDSSASRGFEPVLDSHVGVDKRESDGLNAADKILWGLAVVTTPFIPISDLPKHCGLNST